jgi:hypothetical protein
MRIAVAAVAVVVLGTAAVLAGANRAESKEQFDVSGTGVHYFTTAIVHSQDPATGQWGTQRSTDIVELRGDLEGYLLYHVTSTIADGTMTNTGKQSFSGTVKGSDPVFLFDDEFQFDVDLATGATTGLVRLRESKDAREGKYRCDLDVIGTGLTPEGNASVSYTGTCEVRPG